MLRILRVISQVDRYAGDGQHVAMLGREQILTQYLIRVQAHGEGGLSPLFGMKDLLCNVFMRLSVQ